MKTNIILSDMPFDERWEFRKGLEDKTGEKWMIRNCVANRGGFFQHNIYRYIMYFVFPLTIFFNHCKYDKIVGWQAFYGVVFAFYCRLFSVKKKNFLLIKNFTYKPKGDGLWGRFYYNWMRYIVKSGYIDIFICTSQTHCDYCARIFDEPADRFVHLPFGIEDFTKLLNPDELHQQENFILSLGRSNRDWDWLIDSLADSPYKVKIICDRLHRTDPPANIEILTNVWFADSFRYLAKCKIAVLPIKDRKIASGETVLLQTMSFGKPLVITRPSCLADDYVEDGVTGLIVDKKKEALIEAVRKLYEDQELYDKLAKRERQKYEAEHSIYKYGQYVGQAILNRQNRRSS